MVETKWYIYPMDSETNEYATVELTLQDPECLRRNVKCADGRRRDLIQCPKGYDGIKKIVGAKEQFGLKFEVYREDEEGANAGQVMRYDLWKQDVQQKRRDGTIAKRKAARDFVATS